MPRRSVHESSDVRERGPSLTLTERQLLILGHVGDGLSNKAIAYELGISEQAVKERVSALLKRMGARNRAALGAAAATRRFVGAFTIDPSWLRYLFRHAPLPIAIVAGPDHRFVAFNRAYERAAGARTLLGRRYDEVFANDASVRGLLDRAHSTGQQVLGPTLLQPARGADGATGVVIFDTRDLRS